MNQKLASLDAMGIDVWVRRESGLEESLGDASPAVLLVESVIDVEATATMSQAVVENIEESVMPVCEANIELATDFSTEKAPRLPTESLQHSANEGTPFSDDSAVINAAEPPLGANPSSLLEPVSVHTVLGFGAADADCLVIADPTKSDNSVLLSEQENQLLTAMLKAIGLNREHTFIGQLSELASTEIQHASRVSIDIIKPKVILCMGSVSMQALLQINSSLEEARTTNTTYAQQNIPVIVTYHPAQLLQMPKLKGKSWQDLIRLDLLLECR